MFTPAIATKRGAITLQVPSRRRALRLVEGANFPLIKPDTGASNGPDPAATRRILRSLSNGVTNVLSKKRARVNLRSAILSLAGTIKPVVLHPNTVARTRLRPIVNGLTTGTKATGRARTPGTPKVGCRRCSPARPIVLVSKAATS